MSSFSWKPYGFYQGWLTHIDEFCIPSDDLSVDGETGGRGCTDIQIPCLGRILWMGVEIVLQQPLHEQWAVLCAPAPTQNQFNRCRYRQGGIEAPFEHIRITVEPDIFWICVQCSESALSYSLHRWAFFRNEQKTQVYVHYGCINTNGLRHRFLKPAYSFSALYFQMLQRIAQTKLKQKETCVYSEPTIH